MLNKVKNFISQNALLRDGDALHLVALSGGADSVCLLLMLKQLEYRVEAIHCNFHLRGEESDRDEAFCRDLCERVGVPFHIVHFDTKAYSELHHVSIEMAARELRYDYFERLRKDIGADDILVAHHRDDSVETLLMNLVRGTGIHGLQGIKPRNGRIVRPLLCISRNDIEAWLNDRGQGYVTDSTNLEADVVRNKIRLNIIPLFTEINPSASENIYRTALRIVEAGKVFDKAMSDEVARVVSIVPFLNAEMQVVDIQKLFNTPSTEYLLFSILSPLHFSPSQIEEIAQSAEYRSGQRWYSSTHTLVADRDKFLICKSDVFHEINMKIPETGVYVVYENNDMTQKLSLSLENVDENFVLSREKSCVCLDADRVRFPLRIRNVKQGDRFVPFGMKGSKLVSDYLSDKKKNYFERHAQLVLVDADDRIVWLVAERPDARCCISAKTIKSLVVRYSNK